MKLSPKVRRNLLRERFKAKKELKRAEKDLRENEAKIKLLQSTIDSIKFLGNEQFCQMFKEVSKESFMNEFNEINGIYIISKVEKNKTEFTKFMDLVKDEVKPLKILTTGKLPSIGMDGKALELNPGALVMIKKIPSPKGHVFHIANLGASTPDAQLQYEYALFKLGLGIMPNKEVPKEVVDGQFRQLLTQKVQESN